MDVRAFLDQKYPKNLLPTVDEARALASAHRAAMELFSKNEERAARETIEKQRREDLRLRQQPRRRDVEQEAKGLAERQRDAGIGATSCQRSAAGSSPAAAPSRFTSA